MVAVRTFIADGADVNAADDSRWPPLYLAIEQLSIDIVHELINAGADVNSPREGGWTPLMHAIDAESDAAWQAHHETGHESTELTSMLLEAGAIPTESAIEIAVQYGNQKALDLLGRCRNHVGEGSV